MRKKDGQVGPVNALPAHVDFPTPPLPEAMTMISFTPSMAFRLGKPLNILSCLVGILVPASSLLGIFF